MEKSLKPSLLNQAIILNHAHVSLRPPNYLPPIESKLYAFYP